MIPNGSTVSNPFAWSEIAARADNAIAERSTMNAQQMRMAMIEDRMRRRNAVLTNDLELQGYDRKLGIDQERGINDYGTTGGRFDRGSAIVDDEGSQGYYDALRGQESGGRGNAKNPRSSAQGYYQFVDDTWADVARRYPELGLTPDGRGDEAQEERAIKALTRDNTRALIASGISPTYANTYAAHFLGSGTAAQVLKAPDNMPIGRIVGPKVMRANPHLNGMTVAGFKNWTAKAVGQGGAFTRVPEVGTMTQDADAAGLVAIPSWVYNSDDGDYKDQYEPVIGMVNKQGSQLFRKRAVDPNAPITKTSKEAEISAALTTGEDTENLAKQTAPNSSTTPSAKSLGVNVGDFEVTMRDGKRVLLNKKTGDFTPVPELEE